MKNLLFLMGGVLLVNCVLGLATGKIYYFFKAQTEFIGSVRSISRHDTPIPFWIFFTATAAFGGYVLYFARTSF